jgi:tetratricopeptide (TPR) repeat protein
MRAAMLWICAANGLWAQAGLVIQKNGDGFQFLPAAEIAVNGKDRALALGAKPELPAAASAKLGNVKLGGDTLIADGASGVVAQYGSETQYLYPGGIARKGAPAADAAWKAATFQVKKSPKDNAETSVPGSGFVAYLPGGVKDLAGLCMDERALRLAGGGFAARIALTQAAVAAYGSDPAMAVVESRIANMMRQRLDLFDAGIEGEKNLTEGLLFSQLSEKAYGGMAAHAALRKRLADSRASLNRTMAVLRALASGGMWDAFVLAYRDFEKHQDSYPEMSKLYRKALESSLEEHWSAGKERGKRGEFRRAWRELGLASERQPSNALLRQEVSVAWAQYSRQVAVDRQSKRKNLSLGELDVIEQTRAIAERYRQQNKLDEAMEKLGEAERIDAESLPVLLTKAAIFGSRAETRKALEILDGYDLVAVDREREAGNKLRGELMFQLNDTRDSVRKRVGALWNAGKYQEASATAAKGLLADDADPAILYYAGLSALATRRTEAGLQYLRRYMAVSNSLDADPVQRERVSRWLTEKWPGAATAAEGGRPHWFSGRKLPVGVLYCPSSLMFAARMERVEGSNKFGLQTLWDGDRLQRIKPVFDKGQVATGEKEFVFSYAEGLPHAFSVDAGEKPRTVPADPDALLAEAKVVLPENPLVDTVALARLGGKLITRGVSGNRFFHPFVWERPYYFEFRFDASGRLESARQLGDTQPVVAEFSWDGLRLTAVRVYAAGDGERKGGLLHQRTLHYKGEQLISEDYSGGKIRYNWSNTGILLSAECDKDSGLDNRSRTVFFAAERGRR